MRRRYVTRCVSVTFTVPVLFLALSGYGSEPDSSSDSTAAPAVTDSSSVPQVDDEPRNDMTNERIVEWDQVEAVSETSIRISFTADSESCFGTRAVVKESDVTIAVAVIEGTLPDAPEACTLEARAGSLVVETKEPIGDREIIPLLDPQGLK